MRLKWVSLVFSIFLIAGSLIYIFTQKGGFKNGIDFSGGIKLEIELNDKVTVSSIREAFKKYKIEATVQAAGKGIDNLAKIEIGSQQGSELEKKAESDALFLKNGIYSANSVDYLHYLLDMEIYKTPGKTLNFISTNNVGPTVGDYLRKSAAKLLFATMFFIMVYITIRFQVNYAVAAILGLFHDLLLTLAFVGVFEVPLSIPVIAALLTILGYSINDTVVIFDRLRENLKKTGTNIAFEKQVDMAINQTLTRSFNTTITTLASIVAIYLIADETLSDMALVLIFGITVGTYSSNMIASPILVIWNKFTKKT
jgi:preprotein translocase SecF subunit